MREPRILTVLFIGLELSQEAIAEISAIIHRNTNCTEKLSVSQYSQQDLKNLATWKTATRNKVVEIQDKENVYRTPEDHSVIVVGEELKSVLAKHPTRSEFAIALIQRINEAKKNPNDEMNRVFMNALFILSQEDLVISKEIMRDMHLDDAKIGIIKNVYTFIQK